VCSGAFIEVGTGAFAEYSRVSAYPIIPLPDSVSFNEGATYPLAGLTAAMGLYQKLQLPEPPAASSDTPILVWAGSCISPIVQS